MKQQHFSHTEPTSAPAYECFYLVLAGIFIAALVACNLIIESSAFLG